MALRQYLFLAGKGVSRQSTTSSHASAEAVLFFFLPDMTQMISDHKPRWVKHPTDIK